MLVRGAVTNSIAAEPLYAVTEVVLMMLLPRFMCGREASALWFSVVREQEEKGDALVRPIICIMLHLNVSSTLLMSISARSAHWICWLALLTRMSASVRSQSLINDAQG